MKRSSLLLLIILMETLLCAYRQNRDPKELQKSRTQWVGEKGKKQFYTTKFSLAGLPHYKPAEQVSGVIHEWGSNYFMDSPLGKAWEAEFRKYQPGITFEYNLKSSELGIPGLYTHVADIAPMGRQILWDELLAYQREFDRPPTEITICTGSYNVGGWTYALAVFVSKQNPISQLSLKQLDGIFGAPRTGGWKGMEWDPSVARGPEQNIRTWGELGLKGEWADKPIHVYGYTLKYHFPDEFSKKVFHGASTWNEALKEYANRNAPDGHLVVAGEDMLADLSKDPYGIAYAGIPYETPETKVLALARNDGGPYVPLTLETVHDRSYPLIRDVYFYLNREPGKPLDPKIREFVHYVLSYEGQEALMKDGKYLPLMPDVLEEQLKKVE